MAASLDRPGRFGEPIFALLSVRALRRTMSRSDRRHSIADDAEEFAPRLLDHVGFTVSDYERSKRFYEKALAPLGITLLMEFEGASAGFGTTGRPSFFIEAYGTPTQGRLHIALRAQSRAHVDAFHVAAIEAGAIDNGGPGIRWYHPNYYGAYVLDPDGHNIEAVCHRPE
jgi:catechol 2,3-dioxygenase-like lactoylglutathione lyase family enzyme